ncbi:MAG: NAD(P)H-binding protein [Burkholderiaceae bacterium]|nr:NAD(P)H-binding protein [Burkholderiaceae bacterium]
MLSAAEARAQITTDRVGAGRCAVVAGATGLVGGRLLTRLMAAPDYLRVVALTRRPLPLHGAQLIVRPARFDALDETLHDAVLADPPVDVFCCLGTTMAAAGSREAFAAIDRDAVLALGRWAAARQARRMIVVSAVGADASSRVFYNRIKGEAEAGLQRLALSSLTLLRPSLLVGERRERRLGESLALAVSRPLRALLPRALQPVQADDVAAAMLAAARADAPPREIASAQMHGAAARV